MVKKLSAWSGALAVRITTEAKELGWQEGDNVIIEVKGDEIIIKREVKK